MSSTGWRESSIGGDDMLLDFSSLVYFVVKFSASAFMDEIFALKRFLSGDPITDHFVPCSHWTTNHTSGYNLQK